jgi:hypothetical protein
VSEPPAFWLRPFRMLQPNLRKVDARDVNPRTLVGQAIACGANVLLVSGGGIVAWYPTQLPYQRVNEFMGGDLLGEILGEAHRQGMRVLVRLDISKGHEDWLATHPEWFQRTENGDLRYAWTMPLTCINGPYWQKHNFALISEIMARYKVDGFFYSAYQHSHCFCASCRGAFHAATGLAMPDREDGDDPAWRALVRWRYDQVAAYTARLSAFVHERDPQAILAVGFRLSSDDPRALREAGWLGPQLAKQVDIITLEAFNPLERPLPRYYLWAGEQVRMARAFRANQPTCIILTYSELFASRRSGQPAAQLAYDLLQIAAHGGQPCVALSGTLQQDDRKGIPTVQAVYRHLRDHAAAYEDLRSCAKVALVYSQTTMDYYGRDDPARCCLAEFRGFYEMAVEGHIQFDVLHDAILAETDLSRYDVLILPNVAAISQDQVVCIDRYVSAGGHVIASYETALYDHEGKRLASFALQCLGRRFAERREGHGSYLRLHNKELLSGLELTDLLPLDGALLVTTSLDDGVQQLQDLTFIPPVENNTPEYSYWDDETTMPGLTISQFGQGQAAFLPWEMGYLYHLRGVPEYKQVLLNLLARWTRPLLSTNAPGSVEVTMHHPRGKPERAIVHLLNATGWQSKPLTEVIPLHDIEVWIQGQYVAGRDLVNGEELVLQQQGTGVHMTISRLEGFDAIELAGSAIAFTE